MGGGIEKTQGIYLVFFPYWYAIKPTKPFTKIYSVLGVSDFSDIGDPIGNRTRVTAVKGRCLDRLTIGPHIAVELSTALCGSGSWARTNDQSGMNRVL